MAPRKKPAVRARKVVRGRRRAKGRERRSLDGGGVGVSVGVVVVVVVVGGGVSDEGGGYCEVVLGSIRTCWGFIGAICSGV